MVTDERNEALRADAAKEAIQRFFADKLYHVPDADGKDRPIPDEVLYDRRHVKIVADCHNWDWAYQLIDENVKRHLSEGHDLKRNPHKSDRTAAIRMNHQIVKDFNRCKVPKEFQGGMTILYMMLVEGVVFKGDAREEKKGGDAGRAG